MNNKMTTEEKVLNPIFVKLHKKYEEQKAATQEQLHKRIMLEMSERFETHMRNFESNLYNSKLYGQSFPMKEILLDASYEVAANDEEYIYTQYFVNKYPFSMVKSEKLNEHRNIVKITLLDSDRDAFLAKYGLKVEEKKIPEFYFVSFK